MAIVYLAFGSNLGDRQGYIQKALQLLQTRGVTLRRLSSMIETDPVGGPVQGKFINAVARVETSLSAESLHCLTQSVEQLLGRVKQMRNGPRVIDIDILMYDDIKLVSPALVIPHPRMFERAFVMDPLKEIEAA